MPNSTQPIEEFERILIAGGAIGAGDALALYGMPDSVQEAFAAGWNRRDELAKQLAADAPAPTVADFIAKVGFTEFFAELKKLAADLQATPEQFSEKFGGEEKTAAVADQLIGLMDVAKAHALQSASNQSQTVVGGIQPKWKIFAFNEVFAVYQKVVDIAAVYDELVESEDVFELLAHYGLVAFEKYERFELQAVIDVMERIAQNAQDTANEGTLPAPSRTPEETLLTSTEQLAVFNHPESLRVLIVHHEEALSFAESTDGHDAGAVDRTRIAELKARGHQAVSQDPEIWPFAIRREFGVEVPINSTTSFAEQLDEEQLTAWITTQIEDGHMPLEGTPQLMARYALTEPAEMRQEFAERMTAEDEPVDRRQASAPRG